MKLVIELFFQQCLFGCLSVCLVSIFTDMYLCVCFTVFARWWHISVTQWKNVTALNRRNGIMRRHHQPVNVQPSVCGVVYKHHSLGINVQPSTTASECKHYTLEHFIFMVQNTQMPHTAMCWRSGTVPRKPSGCTVENMWCRRREEKL